MYLEEYRVGRGDSVSIRNIALCVGMHLEEYRLGRGNSVSIRNIALIQGLTSVTDHVYVSLIQLQGGVQGKKDN